MAKKSNKRPPRLIKENTGCMRGLISLFDFRQEHAARKLLSDREHGRDMSIDNGHSNVQNEELNKFTNKVDGRRSGKASVKRLMEEEMSSEHPQRKISSGDVQSIISDLGSVVESRKNHKQRSRKSEVISDAPADQLTSSVSFDNHESEIINLTEKSSHNFDPASLLVELCSYGNRCEETLDVSNNVINFYIALKTIFEKMQNRLDEPEPLPDQRYPILRSALADAANTIVSQNSVNEKQIMGQTYIQTKEIMDALQVLNSNRELIVKLFQDSDSILLKHIQDFQSSRTENLSDNCIENIHMLDEENGNSVICGVTDSNKPFHRQSKYKFLWKKDKTKETQPSKEGSSSNSSRRIVVLKPNPSRIQNHPILSIENSSPQSHHNLGYKEDEERIASYFSLNGIKRRLKRVFGERKKEQHVISMDGMLHRIPIRSKDSSVTGEQQLHNDPAIMSSARKSSSGSENPSGIWQKDKRTIFNDGASSMPGHLIYLEAKKHIAELLGTGDRIHSLPKRRTSRSLGRLLSFPEYNVSVSSRCSLREQQEITLSSEEAECSLVEQILPEATINIEGPLSQNLEASFCSGDDLNDQVKKLDLNRGLTSNDVEDKSHIPEDLNIEGSLDTAEADNIISDLASSQSKPLSELSEEYAIKSERYEEALSVSSVLMLDSSEDKAENLNQADLSQDSQDMDSSLASEDTIKGQEKLSPVSVLQTMYSSEDITSPECSTIDDCNHQMQIFNAEDNDNPSGALMSLDNESIRVCSDVSLARSRYIRSVLEASGLTSTALSDRWLLEDQLIDSSLFDEGEPSFFPQDDEKFLFDCINEVLVEIQERLYKCSPSLSFIRSIIWPAPSGEKLIKEVTKGIEHHIRTHSPKPVDETIKTGVEKEEWMNFRLETENIVIDIWFTVLDDLLEETVFDLWF